MVQTDNFASRWSGYMVAPYTGTYTFGCIADDYLQITVNNQQVAPGSCYSQAAPTWGLGIALNAGDVVSYVAQHAEATGPAYASAYVRVTNGGTTLFADNVIPTEWFQTGVRPTATPHGLVGRYYPGSTLPSAATDTTGTFLVRTDATPSQNWGAGSPVPGGPADNFVARWTGFFKAPQSGDYKFGGVADDGIRIVVNGSDQVNTWNTGATGTVNWASGTVHFNNAGDTLPITVEYKELAGGAGLGLHVDGPGIDKSLAVPSDWLLPQAQVLPSGWNLGVNASGGFSYDSAVIGTSSVVLRDPTGQTHEYKWTGSGYTLPTGEAGQMVRNGDGSVTLQDSDGRTYVFNPDGTIRLVTSPPDDTNPAALAYKYSGSPARLTHINDGVNPSRSAKIAYTGFTDPDDSSNTCAAPPAGTNAAPSGMVCSLTTSDGAVTRFGYSTDGLLQRLERPGGELTDYQYNANNGQNSCPGCIISVRDSLATDAIAAGVRAQDGTERTAIAYDAIGRVASVTLPAAASGAVRLAHSYDYQLGYTQTHTVGATEPSGFSRKVAYDSTLRTTADTDIANLTTTTQWDPAKDLVLSTTDPTGLKSTTIYDYSDRPTDQYGPAPTAWFGSDRKPLSANDAATPHSQTAYDESITGPAVSYYQVAEATNGSGTATKVLSGAPKQHATGLNTGSPGTMDKTWSSNPIGTGAGMVGWGTVSTGELSLPVGTYSFIINHTEGARLWLGDQLIISDWSDGAIRNSAEGPLTVTAGQAPVRFRLEHYSKYGTANPSLRVFVKQNFGFNWTTNFAPYLKPSYGLATTNKVFDSQLGATTTTSNYGATPELGLLQSATADPTGLNYSSSSTYETQGAAGSYLRQTSKTLPGGTTTTYAYYGATETRANPCNTSQTFKQAGMSKLKTGTDPDGTGPLSAQTSEIVYDDAGRTVATRQNTDPWTCTSYDSRGRVSQTVIPTINGRTGRTISYNYAVNGSPLTGSSTDSVTGTSTVNIDLLGRTTSTTDTFGNVTTITRDNLGRTTQVPSLKGTEVPTYDTLSRHQLCLGRFRHRLRRLRPGLGRAIPPGHQRHGQPPSLSGQP
jgi:YD repeat-containing protein